MDSVLCSLLSYAAGINAREFTHDRSDVNDTPQTVDAGHFPLEMDFAAFTCDRHDVEHAAQRVATWQAAPMFVKFKAWKA